MCPRTTSHTPLPPCWRGRAPGRQRAPTRDPQIPQLIKRLTDASPDFARRWEDGTVGKLRSSRKTLHTDLARDIILDCDTLSGPGDQSVVIMTAAPGSENEQKLDLLRVVRTQTLSN